VNPYIFDIRRYSVNDGPGIRTTVFFKGCPLKCWWCHNPESISPLQESICRNQVMDGATIQVEENLGKEVSVPEIFAEIMRDSMFFEESGGGVTFSGGEPLLQKEALAAIAQKCREADIHTALDTSGFAKPTDFLAIMPFIRLYLFDIKLIDDTEHKKITGVSNQNILQNLKQLSDNMADVIIRVPVIPNVNFTDKFFLELMELIKPLSFKRKEIHFLPFHNTAKPKYERLGLEFKMGETPSLDKSALLLWKETFEKLGYKVKIGG
jgi:pyruvate formate lyase activating enzyme